MVRFVFEPSEGLAPFVVYLRSFKDDEVHASSLDPPGYIFPRRTAEEDLTETLASFGKPIVAIGRPGEQLPKVGAYRCYVGEDRWQATVLDLMGRTRFVVMQMGVTPSLHWELTQCIRNLAPGQLVLWLLAYVWGGRALRAVAALVISAILPGFVSIPSSAFPGLRSDIITLFLLKLPQLFA